MIDIFAAPTSAGGLVIRPRGETEHTSSVVPRVVTTRAAPPIQR